MSFDSVSEVHLSLSRAQTSVSAWPVTVCNNEEDRAICEEIHVICGEIIDRMSNILGNEDGDETGNANDDDEPMDSSEDVSCSFISVDETFLILFRRPLTPLPPKPVVLSINGWKSLTVHVARIQYSPTNSLI
jgi:hypothetical protein